VLELRATGLEAAHPLDQRSSAGVRANQVRRTGTLAVGWPTAIEHPRCGDRDAAE
jgi:hypothetical protein